MAVDYFNPRHLNLGQIWEERRQGWLDNVATNRYFWYAYCVTGLLIVSWFALWWVWDDKVRALDELAENSADALRYSEYCKREAKPQSAGTTIISTSATVLSRIAGPVQ